MEHSRIQEQHITTSSDNTDTLGNVDTVTNHDDGNHRLLWLGLPHSKVKVESRSGVY